MIVQIVISFLLSYSDFYRTLLCARCIAYADC